MNDSQTFLQRIVTLLDADLTMLKPDGQHMHGDWWTTLYVVVCDDENAYFHSALVIAGKPRPRFACAEATLRTHSRLSQTLQ